HKPSLRNLAISDSFLLLIHSEIGREARIEEFSEEGRLYPSRSSITLGFDPTQRQSPTLRVLSD
ncbi:hypothetical protein H0H93_015324, partial [Arthromyces matolae]